MTKQWGETFLCANKKLWLHSLPLPVLNTCVLLLLRKKLQVRCKDMRSPTLILVIQVITGRCPIREVKPKCWAFSFKQQICLEPPGPSASCWKTTASYSCGTSVQSCTPPGDFPWAARRRALQQGRQYKECGLTGRSRMATCVLHMNIPTS